MNYYIACVAITNNIILNPTFYNSGDLELKDFFGPLIVSNTIKCDDFKFSYSQDIKAKRISDNTDFLITNFITVVNGATTSDDYLSIFTAD